MCSENMQDMIISIAKALSAFFDEELQCYLQEQSGEEYAAVGCRNGAAD